MKSWIQVLGCALVGGIAGHFLFGWILQYDYYGMVLPGGLMGLAAGIPRKGSLPIAIVCGVAALFAGLLTEWRHYEFVADPSLGYFLTHIHQKSPVKLLMIGAGALIGFWVPFRAQPPKAS